MNGSRSKFWLLLTLVVAVITTLVAMSYINRLRESFGPQPMSKEVVAAKKITKDTLITSDMVKTIEVPTKYADKMALSQIDPKVQQFAKIDFEPETVILSSQLASDKNSTDPIYTIPEGKRAISIATDPPSSVAGQLKAGDYVDVLGIYTRPTDTENAIKKFDNTKVITLLQNVLVLSMGVGTQTQKDNTQATPANIVTLVLSPEDAEKITLMETLGKVKFDLRRAGDTSTPSVNPATGQILN